MNLGKIKVIREQMSQDSDMEMCVQGIYVKVCLRSLCVGDRRKKQDRQRRRRGCNTVLTQPSVNIMEGSRIQHDPSEVRSAKASTLISEGDDSREQLCASMPRN